MGRFQELLQLAFLAVFADPAEQNIFKSYNLKNLIFYLSFKRMSSGSGSFEFSSKNVNFLKKLSIVLEKGFEKLI